MTHGSQARGAAARPAEATVARVDFGGLRLLSDDDAEIEASVPGRLRGPRKALGNAVVVGDRVDIVWDSDRALVNAVSPRRNAFSRRAAGGREEEQVVASNLDQVVVVASLHDPDFKPGLVDRVLVQAARAGIPARLALNKTDLGNEQETSALLAEYAVAGIEGHAVCALTGHGVDELREACRARRSMFVGHSGVGKSTLLSALVPGVDLVRGDVNPTTGKGRHTTSAALLVRAGAGLELVDTPGVRAFSLWGVDADDLVEYYPELKPYLGHCRFDDCRHDREPGCALKAALAAGEVGARRFASYVKLREELAGGFH